MPAPSSTISPCREFLVRQVTDRGSAQMVSSSTSLMPGRRPASAELVKKFRSVRMRGREMSSHWRHIYEPRGFFSGIILTPACPPRHSLLSSRQRHGSHLPALLATQLAHPRPCPPRSPIPSPTAPARLAARRGRAAVLLLRSLEAVQLLEATTSRRISTITLYMIKWVLARWGQTLT